MKRATISLLALAMAGTSCSKSDGGNGSAAANSAQPPVPTAVVTVAAAGAEGCAMRWNGEPATREQVAQRSLEYMTAAVEAGGGVANVTKFPSATIEAAAALPYHCVSFAVGDLEHAGLADVELRAAGTTAPARVHLLMSDEPVRPQAMIQLGARGRIDWNGEQIDLARLRQYAQAQRGLMTGPDDALVVPAADTGFGEVLAVVTALNEAEAEPLLAGCARQPTAASEAQGDRGPHGSTEQPPVGAPLPRC